MNDAIKRIEETRPRRFRRYPEYKDSSVEWMGEIPEGWEVSKIKSLARPGYKTFVDGDWIESPYITSDGIRLIQTGNIGSGEFREKGFRYISEETFKDFGCTEIEPDDILICRLGEPVARACLAPRLGRRMITSVDVCILKPHEEATARFLVYSMSSCLYLEWVGSLVRGSTRDRVSRSMLGSFVVPYPPPSEQRTIEAFLDRETAKIDGLVARKERLIELLQEKRTALITRVVTRGIEPNVPMKDSGVEWLGEIPAHWEVKRLKYVLNAKKGAIKTGPFGSQMKASDMEAGEIKVYNQRSVLDRDFSSGENYVSLEKFTELTAFEVFPGDLLITTRGSIGRCAILPKDAERGVLHPCLMRIQSDHRWILTRFLEIQIQECAIVLDQLRFMSNATTIDVIYSDSMREIWLSVPPVEHQKAIIAYLDRETAKIDSLVAKIRQAIDNLKEFRTALISAAVTGKIDVREEAS